MVTQALSEAEVDVCPACGGIWVDWFDGEVQAVTAETLAAVESLPKAPPAPASEPRNEAVATGACPRCTRQLVAERYVQRISLAPESGPSAMTMPTGADLLRCEDCAGAFVSEPNARMLAVLSPTDAPPRSTVGRELERPLWDRLRAFVRRLGLSD